MAGDAMPKDGAKFEELLKKIKEHGFNVIHTSYSDKRLELCKKHGIKLMIDFLDIENHHVYKSADKAKAVAEKLRGNSAVWGYNIWNDHTAGREAGRERDINTVRAWDPTHPAYSGGCANDNTRVYTNADVMGYYDFHWERGIHLHFPHLLQFLEGSRQHDSYPYTWLSWRPYKYSDHYHRSLWSANTTIACGFKGIMWFLASGFMDAKTLEWKQGKMHVLEVHKEIVPLRGELMKIGLPSALYSTKITKTNENKPLPDGKTEMMPPGLENHGFPQDFWIQPQSGEFRDGCLQGRPKTRRDFCGQSQLASTTNNEVESRQAGESQHVQPQSGQVGGSRRQGRHRDFRTRQSRWRAAAVRGVIHVAATVIVGRDKEKTWAMISTRNCRIVFGVFAFVGVGWASSSAETPGLIPQEGIATAPVQTVWEYSTDGGKTFGKTPPAGAPPKFEFPIILRGTFQIADPTSVAGLWVRLADEKQPTVATICTGGDLNAASGGYWKDVGFCPILLHASVLLNGAPVRLPQGPMLYFWLPVEAELKQGANVIELHGRCHTYWQGPVSKTITAQLISAKTQPAKIYNGPMLGDFGEDYFTLTCRTQMPADLTVEATPANSTAVAATVTSKNRIWHRVKMPVPKDTREVAYTLTATIGQHVTKRGPFTAYLPDIAATEFRFVAFGNVRAHSAATGKWGPNTTTVLRLKPDFILHTGNANEHGTWEYDWERRYFQPGGDLLAAVPTFITPCYRDLNGVVNELHYTPAPDTYLHSWTKVIGPVRLIGLNGNHLWKADEQNAQWLERVLKAAKEKFIFVLNAYPGYSSGKSSRSANLWLDQSRDVVMPLLAKYKATAMLSGWDPDYERCEPTPDKGCTQIVTGAIGKASYRHSGKAGARNPFGQNKGRPWAGAPVPHVCVFDVKGDRVEMKVLALRSQADDTESDLQVLDNKTFTSR